MAKKVLGNSVTEFSILELSGAKNPGIFCPLKKKSWNFLEFFFLNSMKIWYSRNFLVPEFSILQYSVWKFSVLGFYFPENSGIREIIRDCMGYCSFTEKLSVVKKTPIFIGIKTSSYENINGFSYNPN